MEDEAPLEQARFDLEKALQKPYAVVHHLIRLNKYEHAEKRIKEMLVANPRDETAHLLWGILYEKKGQLSSARKKIEEAIGYNPAYAAAHVILGELLAEGLDVQTGLKHLKEGVRLEPTDADYLATYAGYLQLNGKHKEATGLIKQALKIDPQNAHVLNVASIVQPGSKHIHHAIEREPNNPLYLNNLGVDHITHRRFAKAVLILHQAVEGDPTNTMFQQNLMLARKAKNLFYRPKHYINVFITERKNGIVTFYAIWFLLMFVAKMIYPLAILFFILFAIYTWLADPIINLILKVSKQ